MSYNIFSKKAAFQGTTKTADGDIVSGTIEYMVDNHSNQTVNGQKTFTDLSASNISIGERISHTGDSDTRIQFGTDNISFMADGGTQIFTIYGNLNPDRVQVNNGNLIVASGGKIGIGVLTPSFELEVSGDISGSGTFHSVGSASFGNDLSISGSFYGDGSQLTGIAMANNVLAESIIGQVSGSQVSASNGLSTSGNNLVVQVSGTASGLASETNGIKIDLTGLSTTSYSDNDYILISASAGNRKMQVSTLESGFDSLAATQVTSGRFNTARMPLALETQIISASLSISGALFQGDGRLLTGVTSTPSPAGTNSQIQFNDDAAFAGDADLTFLTGSNTLATSNVSASVNISGSSLYLQDEIIVGGQAFLDINANVVANNASFAEITASSTISSSADVYGANFRGNGSTLNNVPLGSSNAASIVFVNNETNKTITTNAGFTFNGTHAVNTGGGFKGTTLSASADVQVGGNIVSDTGDLDVNTAKAKRFKLLSVGDEDTLLDLTSGSYAGTGFSTISMFNSASNALRETVTITSDTLGVGPFFRLQTNAASPIVQVQMWQGQISASADLQVGGHITGSGDVVLGGTMYWDRTGTGINTGPKLTPGGSPTANSLNIDGDSIITIQADTNARFRVGDASTPDLILDITPTVVSSSVPITGSALHTNSGITMATGGGDFTFLSDQGNVTAGSIEMIARGGSDVLNFNDNSISGSGNISGSAIHFENSLNLGSNPLIDANANATLGQLTCFVDTRGNTSLPTDNSRATFYVDESANKFFVYVKYSDGTTKSGSISLT
jgi:hypothetical protein